MECISADKLTEMHSVLFLQCKQFAVRKQFAVQAICSAQAICKLSQFASEPISVRAKARFVANLVQKEK